ncbi:MAG: choice-of-anchor B family protein, partial [Anaerolineae bacterium]|nr:choice-of-anchor B family protein [Anaerolineae bacterium]
MINLHFRRVAMSVMMAVAIWASIGLVSPVQAHGKHRAFYLAADGRDEGACDIAARPCQTVAYVLAQIEQYSAKDAELHIAAGEYVWSDADVASLLSGLLTVQAGFSDAYNVIDEGLFPSHMYGPSVFYRDTLMGWGFTPMDLKGAPPTTMTQAKTNLATQIAQTGQVFPCQNGFAAKIYACDGIELLSHLPFKSFGSTPSRMANIWGFVSKNDEREYILVGVSNGTAIFDVTDALNPREIVTIPAVQNAWREMRTYQFWSEAERRWQAYAYIVTESWGQGLQIVDLSHLPLTATLVTTDHYLQKAHTIHIGDVDYTYGITKTGAAAYAFVNGTNLERGAFHLLDLSNPISPTKVSTPTQSANYTHDGISFVITDSRTAECANPLLILNGPMCELYVDFNQTKVDVFDVTNKTNPTLLSSITYSNARYVHSGWWTTDRRYVTVHDERDEFDLGISMTVRALDLGSLRSPQIITIFQSNIPAIDHNGYVLGDHYYQSSYQRGLMIFDISDPRTLRPIASFDTYPDGDLPRYNGAWGTYPFFPSGNIAIGDIENGLFMVRRVGAQAPATSTPTPMPSTTTPTSSPTVTTTPVSSPTAPPSPCLLYTS